MYRITKAVRYAPDGFTVHELAPGDYESLTDEQLSYARRANALASENKAVQAAPENRAKHGRRNTRRG